MTVLLAVLGTITVFLVAAVALIILGNHEASRHHEHF